MRVQKFDKKWRLPMSIKKTFRRIDINSALKELLNAPKIPEEERELSREDALKIMTDGFRNLLSLGYSMKGIVEYLKKTNCPIKDIKQGEIFNLVKEEKGAPTKRKYRHNTNKTTTGNIPELNATDADGLSLKLKTTQRGSKTEKEQPEEVEILNFEKGSFSLDDDLPLDEI